MSSKENPMATRIDNLTDVELLEEFVSLNIWKNYFADDWGSGDWGHLGLLNDQLNARPHILKETIEEFYDEAAAEAQEKLNNDENSHYGREQFLKDMEEMPK